jgi:hypothetical protein
MIHSTLDYMAAAAVSFAGLIGVTFGLWAILFLLFSI